LGARKQKLLGFGYAVQGERLKVEGTEGFDLGFWISDFGLKWMCRLRMSRLRMSRLRILDVSISDLEPVVVPGGRDYAAASTRQKAGIRRTFKN
jgi:hypothetical protein